MFELIALVVIGTTIWVAADVKDRPAPGGIHPIGWVVGCLVLWIVFFPWYLGARTRAPVWPGGTPPPPGWYADPDDKRRKRWWDGKQWADPS